MLWVLNKLLRFQFSILNLCVNRGEHEEEYRAVHRSKNLAINNSQYKPVVQKFMIIGLSLEEFHGRLSQHDDHVPSNSSECFYFKILDRGYGRKWFQKNLRKSGTKITPGGNYTLVKERANSLETYDSDIEKAGGESNTAQKEDTDDEIIEVPTRHGF